MDQPENKTERLHMLISPSELKAIDDWGFKNRIRTKAEAVRRLCQIGLAYDLHGKAMVGNITRAMKALNLTIQKLEEEGAKLPRGLRGGHAVVLDELVAAFSAATAIMIATRIQSDGDDDRGADALAAEAQSYIELLKGAKP